jgi:hypothetical protein
VIDLFCLRSCAEPRHPQSAALVYRLLAHDGWFDRKSVGAYSNAYCSEFELRQWFTFDERDRRSIP